VSFVIGAGEPVDYRDTNNYIAGSMEKYSDRIIATSLSSLLPDHRCILSSNRPRRTDTSAADTILPRSGTAIDHASRHRKSDRRRKLLSSARPASTFRRPFLLTSTA